jgi:hypothetical protein
MALQLTGCSTWLPSTAGPRQLIQDERPAAVRVTKTDGEQVELRAPELRGDSVRGGGRWPTRAGVAVSDIGTIEFRRSSPGRTAALLILIGAGLVGVAQVYLRVAGYGTN